VAWGTAALAQVTAGSASFWTWAQVLQPGSALPKQQAGRRGVGKTSSIKQGSPLSMKKPFLKKLAYQKLANLIGLRYFYPRQTTPFQ
jgi:hypothetical protein